MSLPLQIDRKADQPLYQQIASQIKVQISDGRLPSGTRLPTVRHLAESLGVTRLTAHNAYSELQADGWIEATVGRGTFVSATALPQEILNMVSQPADPDKVLDNMQRVDQLVGVRSLAYADSDPSLLPVAEFWHALQGMRDTANAFLRYGSPQGDPHLRVQLATLAHERGIEAVPDEIIVTAGATQALSLVAQALARPGESVVVEQPTYLGLLHILKAYDLRPVGVPLDDEGPRLDILERIVLQQRPRFFYTIPSFHNPTGLSMSPARRQALLDLAERHGLLLVEDDVYGRLAYDMPAPPALKAMDRRGLVIYLDGFAKTLMAGLRIGYAIAPPPLHEQLLSLRRAADLCGSPFVQRALAEFLSQGWLKTGLRHALPVYQERRDTLMRSLSRWMPESVQWTIPGGGFCTWLTLPRCRTLGDLYQAALRRGMAFTPGDVFLAEPGQDRYLRLCFGSQPAHVIQEGVAILGNLIQERIQPENQRPEKATDWVPLV